MSDRIRGAVAAILNDRELVINRGSEDGVEIGTRFAVLNTRAVGIRDPETGEDLGSIEVEKTLIKVVRLEKRLAVARTFRTHFVPGSGLGALGAWMGYPSRRIVETLRADEATFVDLDEEDSFVKIGDPVVEIAGEEFLEKAPAEIGP